jgi:hypothetical protein
VNRLLTLSARSNLSDPAMRSFLALSCNIFCMLCVALSHAQMLIDLEEMDVVLIKVSGSSITDKAVKETLNTDAIDWFARILSSEVSTSFRSLSSPQHADEPYTPDNDKTCRSTNTAFIVMHGAGSFGHQSAKEYGLKGQMFVPQPVANRTGSGEQEKLHRRRINAEGRTDSTVGIDTESAHGFNIRRARDERSKHFALLFSPFYAGTRLRQYLYRKDHECWERSHRLQLQHFYRLFWCNRFSA